MIRFPLAPMSGLLLWLTALVLPLPLVMLWLGSRVSAGPVTWLPALFVAAVYLGVWLYMRPSAFEVLESSLDVVWPLRRLSIPHPDIDRVETLDGRTFRERYGYGMRIGAGGLWGGFGLLKTRTVTFRFYISRMDDYVIVWRHSDRPLLITPAEPLAFVELVDRRRRERGASASPTGPG